MVDNVDGGPSWRSTWRTTGFTLLLGWMVKSMGGN